MNQQTKMKLVAEMISAWSGIDYGLLMEDSGFCDLLEKSAKNLPMIDMHNQAVEYIKGAY